MRPADDTNPIGEPLVGVPAVMEFLGISRATVYRLAGTPGGIPCVRIGKSVRFRPADIRGYQDQATESHVDHGRAATLLAAVGGRAGGR